MGAPPSVRCRDCFTCSTLIARWASKYLRRAMQVCLAVCLLEKISSSLSSAPWSSGFRISSVLIWKQFITQAASVTFSYYSDCSFYLFLKCIFIQMTKLTLWGSHVVGCCFVLPDWRGVGARPACQKAPERHGKKKRWRRTSWRGSSRMHVSIPAATACNQPHQTEWSVATCTPWEERTQQGIKMWTASRAR